MALKMKISFYISRKNKLTLSPVPSFLYSQYFATFQWKESGEKSKILFAQRLTTGLTRDSFVIIDQGGKRGRGNPKEAERNSSAECMYRDDETEQRATLFSIRSQSSRYAAA